MKSLIKSTYNHIAVGAIITSALFLFANSAFAATAPTLGLAGDYAVFANSAIHTDPGASTITGNIGVGPAVTSTAITGFALNLPASSPFSTSAQVSGSVYAFDYANPTPANVNTASLNMGAAYTAAAGEASTSACPGSGTLTGLTLVAGVYTCAVNVNIPTDLTLSGSATDIWIFQIAGTLDMAAAKTVHLTGGALPQNVFWQVSGAVTIGANTHFEGIVLGQTAITLGNLASINGRLLAQTAVNLDSNTITVPTTPPVPGPVFIDLNTNGTLDSGESSFTTIQAAITAASAGNTIHIKAGTYTESGQIVINKNLSIVGDDKTTTTIKSAQNTGNTGDTKGWFLVNSGMSFNLSNVTLDGTGYKIYQAIRYADGSLGGVISNVVFTHIAYEQSGPQYNGAGVRIGNSGNVDVSNSSFDNIGRVGVIAEGGTGTFSGNTYTGKGIGDWLDYAFDVERGSQVTIQNNNISGNRGVASSDGSTSSGISIWDDAGTQATINGNTITDNTAGIAVAMASGVSDPVITIGSGNTINGNDYGLDMQNAGAPGSPTVTIIGSTLSGNITGINVASSTSVANMSLHNSVLTNNGTSTANIGVGVLDATNNWWGTTASTDIASKIVGSTNYAPWYVNAEKTILNTDPVPEVKVTSIPGGHRHEASSAPAGRVLGASTGPDGSSDDSLQIIAIKTQLIALIRELIAMLQIQLQAARDAGQY